MSAFGTGASGSNLGLISSKFFLLPYGIYSFPFSIAEQAGLLIVNFAFRSYENKLFHGGLIEKIFRLMTYKVKRNTYTVSLCYIF